MPKFTKVSFCQKLIFWHQTSSHKCSSSMCLYCVSKVSDCFSKGCGTSLFHALSMHKQNPLRITKGNSSFLIRMFILWISMC